MTLENENNPVSGFPTDQKSENPDSNNEKPRNKGGRPKGSKDKKSRNKGGRPRESGLALRQQRKYEISLTEAVRAGLHPDIYVEYYKTILRGDNPKLETKDGIDYIIVDPNPLLPSPTLEQKNAAMRALADRGYGLPAQSINIDAEFKTRVEAQLTGISQQQLEAMSMNTIMAIREMFKLPEKTDNSDAEDAEFTEITENSDTQG